MFTLPFKLHFERRPRPLPPEFEELCQNVAELANVVEEVRKMAEATQRKAYRDSEKDNHQAPVDPAILGATRPSEVDDWQTGDPAA